MKVSVAAVRRAPPAILAKRAIRAADAMLARLHRIARPATPRVVLFDVCNPFGFDAQAPVIRALHARKRVRIEVTSGGMSRAELAGLLSQHDIDPALVAPPQAARHRWYDASVITDSPSVRVWRSAKRLYLHHGSSFSNLVNPYAIRLLLAGDAEYLCCLSPAELAQCEAFGGERLRANAIVTGQPKLDRLVAGGYSRRDFLASLNLDPERTTVLLTSHWMAESLFRSGPLEALRDYFRASDLNLLVTAHFHLFDVESHRFSGNIDWQSRLAATFDGPRMRVLPRAADNRPILWAADMLIGDHSSIHLEYATLFRPMILLRRPAVAFVDDTHTAMLADSAWFVSSSEEIPRLIPRALATPVTHDARQQLLDYCLAYLGHSAERVADVVESLALHGRLPQDAGRPDLPRNAPGAGLSQASA